jgi:hypothetical protein
MGLAIAILAGLYASYAVLFQKDPLGSQHQTKSYIEHEKRTCMEVSIYVSDPSQIGSEQVAWYGYPYWMIITQAREKMRDLGPEFAHYESPFTCSVYDPRRRRRVCQSNLSHGDCLWGNDP